MNSILVIAFALTIAVIAAQNGNLIQDSNLLEQYISRTVQPVPPKGNERIELLGPFGLLTKLEAKYPLWPRPILRTKIGLSRLQGLLSGHLFNPHEGHHARLDDIDRIGLIQDLGDLEEIDPQLLI